MTAFGGDFLVAPNPIDFDKILLEFSRIEETKNVLVMLVVILIWLSYFIGLVFARKADRNDKRKIISCYINHPLQEKLGQDFTTYRISIQTGSWIGSGTTASVGMTLYSDETKHGVSLYFNNDDPDKVLFARGSVNTYFVSLSEPLTNLVKIEIWHDNSGRSPSWFLQDIIFSEEDNSYSWHFAANRWLAVDKGNKSIVAYVDLTKADELKKFKNRFYTRAAKQFTNAHLWLSLFTKSVHCPFTRCQRLSCCLLVLMATMVTNAMFYKFGLKWTEILLIGPFQVSWRGIKTGIQSSLIVLPISVLTVLIFDNIKQKQVQAYGNGASLSEEKVKGCLSRPFVAIAWFLCISGALVSSVFTIFYSLMWGTDIANRWLVSMIVSFLQDVFITQPIKILVLVSLLAMIIKKPTNQHDNIIIFKNQELTSLAVTKPTAEDMREARIFAKSKTASKHFLTELGLYLPFVILLFILCYGNRDSKRFMVTNSLLNIAPNFNKVTGAQSFWNWLKEEPISALYGTTWYNGQTFRETNGFISDMKMQLVGMPRLRQLRVKETSCTEIDLTRQFKRCIPSYSISSEDDTPYSLPEWKKQHFVNLTSYFIIFKRKQMCPKPWRYMNFKSIQTLPIYGTNTLYGGGGFVADLGYNKSTAYNVVHSLQENKWIDESTAAVFLEFTVFNPTSALFGSVRYIYERSQSGSINTITRINTLTVYSPTNKSMYFFTQVCRFFVMVMILVTLVNEFIRIVKQGIVLYFKEVWNCVQLIEAISIVLAIVMFYLKEKYVGKFITRVKANSFETSSTDYIVLWSDMETFILSFVIFVVTLKLLRLIRFNKSVYQLHRTIFQSIKNLGSLFQLFLVIMIALSFMATSAFGNFSNDFTTFVKSFNKLLNLMVGGKSVFQKDSSFSESPLGLLFVLFYLFLNTFLVVNLLLSVIIDSFAASKSRTDPKVQENAKMSDFTKKLIRTAFSKKNKKLGKFMYKKLGKDSLYKKRKKNDEEYIDQCVDPAEYDFKGEELQKECCVKRNPSCENKMLSQEILQLDLASQEDTEENLYDDDEDDVCLVEVKGSLTEIINILRSIIPEEKG